jgi:hypothetical protein
MRLVYSRQIMKSKIKSLNNWKPPSKKMIKNSSIPRETLSQKTEKSRILKSKQLNSKSNLRHSKSRLRQLKRNLNKKIRISSSTSKVWLWKGRWPSSSKWTNRRKISRYRISKVKYLVSNSFKTQTISKKLWLSRISATKCSR